MGTSITCRYSEGKKYSEKEKLQSCKKYYFRPLVLIRSNPDCEKCTIEFCVVVGKYTSGGKFSTRVLQASMISELIVCKVCAVKINFCGYIVMTVSQWSSEHTCLRLSSIHVKGIVA